MKGDLSWFCVQLRFRSYWTSLCSAIKFWTEIMKIDFPCTTSMLCQLCTLYLVQVVHLTFWSSWKHANSIALLGCIVNYQWSSIGKLSNGTILSTWWSVDLKLSQSFRHNAEVFSLLDQPLTSKAERPSNTGTLRKGKMENQILICALTLEIRSKIFHRRMHSPGS
jgi:hypothetical protein